MAEPIDGLRRQLALHAHNPSTERCPLCDRAYCTPYAEATALLAHAGERLGDADGTPDVVGRAA